MGVYDMNDKIQQRNVFGANIVTNFLSERISTPRTQGFIIGFITGIITSIIGSFIYDAVKGLI